MDFLSDIETGIAEALAGLTGVQILERETDEIRESKAIVVKAEIVKEFSAGSRIWEVEIEVALRVNRMEHNADVAKDTFQNMFALVCNTDKDNLCDPAKVTLFSWYVQGTSSQWAQDVSVQSVKVRCHAQQVS
jgi:hypothetical protein